MLTKIVGDKQNYKITPEKMAAFNMRSLQQVMEIADMYLAVSSLYLPWNWNEAAMTVL